MKKVLVFVLLCVTLFSGFAAGAKEDAGAYPAKKITFVIPYAAGDGLDTSTRALLENADFPVQTVVENIVGGSGTIGLQEAFGRKPDGYTVTILSNGPSIAQPLMNRTLTYALDDWEVLTFTTSHVLATLGCNKNLKIADSDALREFLLTGRPFTVGVPSMTGFGYVAALTMFYQMDILDKVTWVSYDGAPALYQAYLSGEVDFVTFDDNFAAQYVNAGEDVMIGVVLHDTRSQYFPNVAAASEWGVDGLGGNIGFKAAAVKKGTPKEVCDYLTEVINKAVVTKGYQDWCRNNYFGVITEDWISTSQEATDLLFSVRAVNKQMFELSGLL